MMHHSTEAGEIFFENEIYFGQFANLNQRSDWAIFLHAWMLTPKKKQISQLKLKHRHDKTFNIEFVSWHTKQ